MFPVLVYGAANVLFLLMALFVRLDPQRYGAYVPLYTAGKVISAVSALGWCVFSWERIINAFFMNDPESFIWIVGGSLLFIAAGDILSACGGVALVWKLKQVEAAVFQPIAAGPIAAEPEAGKPDLL
ncbi:hypothetical protein FACS1894110_07640 [Spirochaetia bacterium]|nr:hypothetical protein FACS1894110_07640 [Spirochaetia bacterium]